MKKFRVYYKFPTGSDGNYPPANSWESLFADSREDAEIKIMAIIHKHKEKLDKAGFQYSGIEYDGEPYTFEDFISRFELKDAWWLK